ncbi:hypothetical protein DRF75_03970 [Ehrlichia minasensis]|uniref:Uncharacterized protein n=1 Tax=Ehrlichia minasensis TaxID=1242993 RepID=A0A4Q6I7B2_9RICK|nr:hypothetical protein [Ehrlichia minasensis]RZB12489.1 hypothetical protein DRF75_03970 [Ehrlichia minasensis]
MGNEVLNSGMVIASLVLAMMIILVIAMIAMMYYDYSIYQSKVIEDFKQSKQTRDAATQTDGDPIVDFVRVSGERPSRIPIRQTRVSQTSPLTPEKKCKKVDISEEQSYSPSSQVQAVQCCGQIQNLHVD